MNSHPKISIITPCYNHEKYIAETIESVLSQGYPNLEYIVIDDGSTDKSWEIIQKYKDKLFYVERLEGYRDTPIHAINYGFSKSSGEILGWINSKNILLFNSLFTIAEIFNQFEEIEWLTGIATAINDKSQIVKVVPYKKNIYDYLIGKWQVIQQESTFWKKSLWERIGSELEGRRKWSFDTGLWVKFFRETELYHANTIFGAYRWIPGAQSIRQKDVFEEHTLKALEELKGTASERQIGLAGYYRMLYLLRHGLKNIPDSMYRKMFFLNKFYYSTVDYKLEDQGWHINKINPFKKGF